MFIGTKQEKSLSNNTIYCMCSKICSSEAVCVFQCKNSEDGTVARGHIQRVYPGGAGKLFGWDVNGNENQVQLYEHSRKCI